MYSFLSIFFYDILVYFKIKSSRQTIQSVPNTSFSKLFVVDRSRAIWLQTKGDCLSKLKNSEKESYKAQNDSKLFWTSINSSENAANNNLIQTKELIPSTSKHKIFVTEEDKNSTWAKICLKNKMPARCSNEDVKTHPLLKCSKQSKSSNKILKKALLSTRKDVIFKKIVRSCKRYYCQEFRKYIGVGRKEWIKTKFNKEAITCNVRNFLFSLFEEHQSRCMEDLLLCFIEKGNKKSSFKIADSTITHEVFSMLYRFNAVKLMKLLQLVEFSKLMLSFLNIPLISDKILKGNTDIELRNTLEFYIEDIKRIWRLSIMNNKMHSDNN